jgi:hypothetical protein
MKKKLRIFLSLTVAICALGCVYLQFRTKGVTPIPTVAQIAPNAAPTLNGSVELPTITSLQQPTNSKKRIYPKIENESSNEIEAENELEDDDARSQEDRATGWREALELEKERTKDLTTGEIPREAYFKAIEMTKRKQEEVWNNPTQSRGAISRARWLDRGPNNIGGRTRSLLIDKNDTTRRTIWAGSVGGGLWKTTNINATTPRWEKADDYLASLAVGALAQNPTNPQIMYAGTGEAYNNIDAQPGLGIFKTTDGGKNWSLLRSTDSRIATGSGGGGGRFNYCQDLLVLSNGDVFSASSTGLYRSQDGGTTFVKVLGSGTPGFANDKFYDVQVSSTGAIYACTNLDVYKSTTGGASGSWVSLAQDRTNGFPPQWDRIEMAVSRSNPDVIYVIGALGGAGTPVYKTTDGGLTWRLIGTPTAPAGGDFTNGQAWYDLDIAVDPNNANRVMVAGIGILLSENGGTVWSHINPLGGYPFTADIHPDNHVILFDETDSRTIYFGNDGGVYRTTNGTSTAAAMRSFAKNQDYNVTQYYGGEMHPTKQLFIAGAQDNGTHIMEGGGANPGRAVRGGDGFLACIDQTDPNYMICSSQFGSWGLSTNGGASFSGGLATNAEFLTPADIDDNTHIAYLQTGNADLYRWNLATGASQLVDLVGFTANSGTATRVVNSIDLIYADPNTPNRIYIGAAGILYYIDNANVGTSFTPTVVRNFGGAISGIDFERGNSNHILVSISNYGVANSIWELKNGVWTGVEGTAVANNLPDMPVHWPIFNPKNPTQAMIGTELGVWTTELLDGANTVWLPPVPRLGAPITRFERLQSRVSDNLVAGFSHGRGVFSSSVFSTPTAVADYQQVSYLNTPIVFKGDQSNAADKYRWTFGDGSTSDTTENTAHQYGSIGVYGVTLTVNDTVRATGGVKILPNLTVPYKAGSTGYQGDFEGNDQHNGVWNRSGSKWQKAKSSQIYKEGTHSGNFAYVIAPNDANYESNSYSLLYLPNYDLTERGIYDFSFWGKYSTQAGYDGFNVEYSLDKGITWQQLGDVRSGWYDYRNLSADDAGFPIGTAFFTGQSSQWTRYNLNISNLAGNANLAFRFVFRSDASQNQAGVAIDDIEITKFDGESKTRIIESSAQFTSSQDKILVSFATTPEYYAQKFEIEKSENGLTYSRSTELVATGRLALDRQSYAYTIQNTDADLYYIRIKSSNSDAATNYNYSFYSPIMVVNRNKDQPLSAILIFPNPFTTTINMTFNGVLDDTPIRYELFDEIGRLILDKTVNVTGVSYQLNAANLARGAYFLRYTIGTAKTQTVRVMRN